MSRKTANGPSRNKKKVCDRLIGDDVSEVDPSYKLFLEHLSEVGSSYFCDVPDGDHGMPASVRYEVDKDCTSVLNNSLHRNRRGPKTKRPRVSVTSGRDAHISVKEMDTPTDESYAAFMSTMRIEDGFMVVEPEPGVSVTSGTDAHINVKEMDTSIDESYAAFLSMMRIEDGFMVVEPEPGVTFVYGKEDETPAGYGKMRTASSTKERKHSINALENMTEDRLGKNDNIISECGINGPAPESSAFNVCEDHQGEPAAFSSGVPSTFDEKLHSVLSQPYDGSEHKKLMRKATEQKPVSRLKHLRNACKRYDTDILGLSYLDHYPDLAKQIHSADTDEGRLNLLRKFFFWLENLSHEGAYMPWKSKGLACDPIVADD
ncbi:uncharacterized protein LOC124646520 [Lolium rigidum]|uniref:uncharacterized protein LOC124646520 n=1 Tax=Lolium rigidum TaxID=89674 RepID=UPI001F5DD4AF|nr:uncharacterized protein LOC124646520 [Lolium rigidum]